MHIRTATMDDLDAVTGGGGRLFPGGRGCHTG